MENGQEETEQQRRDRLEFEAALAEGALPSIADLPVPQSASFTNHARQMEINDNPVIPPDQTGMTVDEYYSRTGAAPPEQGTPFDPRYAWTHDVMYMKVDFDNPFSLGEITKHLKQLLLHHDLIRSSGLSEENSISSLMNVVRQKGGDDNYNRIFPQWEETTFCEFDHQWENLNHCFLKNGIRDFEELVHKARRLFKLYAPNYSIDAMNSASIRRQLETCERDLAYALDDIAELRRTIEDQRRTIEDQRRTILFHTVREQGNNIERS